MIKLTTLTAAVATLLTGCVVGPDAGYGYGYGQPYYSDPGYAYGPTYPPVYGSVNIWGGGGDRDWDRRDYRHGDRDWRHDRGWGDRGNANGNGWNHGNGGNRSGDGNRANGGSRDWRSGQTDDDRGHGRWH
ncbi:hypothetical protein [Burkholderia sp. Ac-20353]|uniref:hypothetical protein n=1 Tax=Burkholderia sp. Ac-20353 TaxID=2703894 RepID=UPI00197B08B9|nr:hypothetical protein [Burkholderia sp. Ac-20353]MBN3790151.1 hypothetical protein [Burkholderia sp. Ac-20353]